MVDNASTDGSDAGDRRAVPRRPADPQRREHRVPGQQPGVRQLDGVDYVGLVNPDSFVEPGWLRPSSTHSRPTRPWAPSARGCSSPTGSSTSGSAPPRSSPGTADRRTLGVQVSGARVDGNDRWRDAQFGEGTWGIEHDPPGVGSSGRAERRSCGCRPGSPIPGTPPPAAGPRQGGRAHSAGRAAPGRRGAQADHLALRDRRASRRRRRRPCVGRDPALRRTARHRQQRRLDRLRGRLRRRPRVPRARRGPVPGARRGVRMVRWQRAAPPSLPGRRRTVRRALLPLLRGHRPRVARAHAAGATDTCPTPWCAMCTPHRPARGRRCSSTTSSATGC